VSKLDNLKKLQRELEASVDQLPLGNTAEDIVHGEGSVDAEVMFIGEAPGYHEQIQRRPFVGRSGQLLRKTLIEVNLPPEKVFISNIIKARPPENRDPTEEEIEAYKPFLNREIEIISPGLIATLGRYSMQKFLPYVKISQVHGRLHKVEWNDKTIFVLPMYHPAAGLRSTNVKQSFIDDFKKIEKTLLWIGEQQKTIKFEEKIKDSLL